HMFCTARTCKRRAGMATDLCCQTSRELVVMWSRVLVLLDGSPTMAQIVPTLQELLGGTGALVHLLTVRPPVREPLHLPDRVVYIDELIQQERALWLDYLARQASHLAYNGIVVHRTVRFGDPLAEVLTAVERHGMHMIALVAQT